MITGVLCLVSLAQAAPPAPLSGGIAGQVKGGAGVAQMGAAVFLYNRSDQLVRQVLTNDQGKFAFDALGPDLYSIRVTLASFIPAIRRNIAVAAGSESVLQINLASLLSSVDLVSSGAPRGTLMSDDWKWILRTSQATRPVVRLLPVHGASSSHSTATLFSDTTCLVRLSAGDGESFTTGAPHDLGTAFALATSINGSARVQFSGNLGYAVNSGLPAGGFRASYFRTQENGPGPVITLTVRQLYMPNRANSETVAGADGAPALRTASLAMLDKLELGDNLHLEYGASLESVSFLQRLNYVSPFARATFDLDEKSSLKFGFSSGTEPTELLDRGGEPDADLNRDLAALARLPRVSRRDSQANVQRTQTFEVGYHRVQGSRTYSAGVYHEAVSNAALLMSGPSDFVPISDSVPDLGSRSRIFNVGNYQDFGYMARVGQSLGDHVEASVAAGRGTALLADPRDVASNDPNDVRALIHPAQRSWVTIRIAAALPVSGTRVSTDYGWTDFRAVMPSHLFLTQDSGTQQSSQETGLNIRVRQPLPVISGLPGRLEVTMDLRNLLAQGYLPLAAEGRRALLTNSPRAVRGGVSFIF